MNDLAQLITLPPLATASGLWTWSEFLKETLLTNRFVTDPWREAVLDLGSGTLRLVVFEYSNGLLREVFEHKCRAALGFGMCEDNKYALNQKGKSAALDFMIECGIALVREKARAATLLPTAAFRDTKIDKTFIDNMAEHIALGIRAATACKNGTNLDVVNARKFLLTAKGDYELVEFARDPLEEDQESILTGLSHLYGLRDAHGPFFGIGHNTLHFGFAANHTLVEGSFGAIQAGYEKHGGISVEEARAKTNEKLEKAGKEILQYHGGTA